MHLIRHHCRTQRIQADWHKVWSDANLFLQRHQVVPMPHRLFLTTTQQRVNGRRCEAGGTVTLRIHTDGHIGDGEVLVVFVQRVKIHNLHQDIKRTSQLVGFPQRVLYGDADHNVCPQLPGKVGRIVIAQAAIAEHLITNSDRREDGRDGHRGTHSLRQDARGEVYLAVIDDVCRHTGKGDGQTVEVHRVGIAHAELLQEHIQVLALDDTTGIRVTLAERQSPRQHIGILPLSVFNTLTTQILPI